jgi:hypothetical protein
MMVEGKWRQPGDAAPSFRLPAINRDGVISLDDYRGRSPVLVTCSVGFIARSAVAGSCSSARPRRSSRRWAWKPSSSLTRP